MGRMRRMGKERTGRSGEDGDREGGEREDRKIRRGWG